MASWMGYCRTCGLGSLGSCYRVFRSEFYHHTWSAHVLLYIQPLTLREMESHHRVLNPTMKGSMKRIWKFYLYIKMVTLALIWRIDGREVRMKVGKPAPRVLK